MNWNRKNYAILVNSYDTLELHKLDANKKGKDEQTII